MIENGRLKEERRRLMDISNELRSDLNKCLHTTGIAPAPKVTDTPSPINHEFNDIVEKFQSSLKSDDIFPPAPQPKVAPLSAKVSPGLSSSMDRGHSASVGIDDIKIEGSNIGGEKVLID